MGGLGNQLFQIFSTMAYAITCGHKFCFLDLNELNFGKTRKTYWNDFLIEFKNNDLLVKSFKNVSMYGVKEISFNYFDYSHALIDIDKNFMLDGYFQSHKYFNHIKKYIYNFINIKEKKDNAIKKFNYQYDYEKTISIHFRMDDYIHQQHYHPVMNPQYYYNALSFMIEQNIDCKYVLCFFQETDSSIVQKYLDILSNTYLNLVFVVISHELEDWEQMMIMSNCKYNIIANSSFSWWGAYFNNHDNKIICYPKKWFGQAKKLDTRDLCLPEWVEINDLQECKTSTNNFIFI